MPDTFQFLKAFKLKRGIKIFGYTFSHIEISHIEITKYREYMYPVLIEIDPGKNVYPKMFKDWLLNLLSKDRIVKSRYGNPYKCFVTDLKMDQYTVTFVGHAYRIIDK